MNDIYRGTFGRLSLALFSMKRVRPLGVTLEYLPGLRWLTLTVGLIFVAASVRVRL